MATDQSLYLTHAIDDGPSIHTDYKTYILW